MKRFSMLIFLSILLAACAPFQPGVVLATKDPRPLPQTAEVPPALTPTLQPDGPVEAPPGLCLAQKKHDPLPATSYIDLPQAIAEYLNSGATPVELAQELEASGYGSQPASVLAADMSGDGRPEAVVSLVDASSSLRGGRGTLLVYGCQDGRYELVYQMAAREHEMGPRLLFLQDLDGDEQAETVASLTSCGASTCFEDVQILAWDDEAIEPRLEGASSELPNPKIAVRDDNGDGIFDLLVTAMGAGSVGAGPPRSLTRIWSLNQESGLWEMGADTPGEPVFRIHLVHDADALVATGEYEDAVARYQRVLEDDSLQAWLDPQAERADLSAYASFKLAAVYTILGEDELAQAQKDELAARYPSGSGQAHFTRLADTFRQVYSSQGLTAACDAVRTGVEQNPSGILRIFEYGYGNPAYTSRDICPW